MSCADDTGRMILQRSAGRGGTYTYFFCRNKNHKHQPCDGRYTSTERIETAIADYYRTLRFTPAFTNALRTRLEETLKTQHTAANQLRVDLEKQLTELNRKEEKLLGLAADDTLPRDVIRNRVNEYRTQRARITDRLHIANDDLTDTVAYLETAVELLHNAGDLYQRAEDEHRRLLNQALFSKILVDDDEVTEVESNEPFAAIAIAEQTIRGSSSAQNERQLSFALQIVRNNKAAPEGGLVRYRSEALVQAMHCVMGSTSNHMVGVLGAYSKTKVTAGQVHSLLEKARAERLDREPTVARLRTPKELPAEVQSAIVDGYRSGASMKELARAFGVHRTTIRAALDRQGAPIREQRAISSAQVATASRLYLSGLSLAAVGEKLGFNAQTIANHLRRSGVSLRDPHDRVQ